MPEPRRAPEEEPCPRCGAAVRVSSSTCPNCGLHLIVACPQCGEYAGVEEPACPHCGQPLGDYRQGSAYYIKLANLYLQNHVADRAQEALERAEAEAAGDADVLAQIAGEYAEGGFRNRAIAAYERAIEAAPRDPALHARLGAFYRQHGERAKSAAMFQKAEELGSQEPVVACELARLDLEAGAAQKAVSRLQPLLRKQPVEPRAVLLMGDALQSLGDRDAAVAHYRRVVQLVPGDSEASQEAQGKLAHLGATPGKPARIASSRPTAGERPGCVTLYALLLIAGGAFGLLGAVALAVFYAGGLPQFEEAVRQQGIAGIDLNRLTPFLGLAFALSLLSAIVNLAIGIGLWMRKNWARLAVITFTTLSFVLGLVEVTRLSGALSGTGGGVDFAGLPAPVVFGLLAGFVVQAVIIFWFLIHRDSFE